MDKKTDDTNTDAAASKAPDEEQRSVRHSLPRCFWRLFSYCGSLKGGAFYSFAGSLFLRCYPENDSGRPCAQDVI